MSKKNKKINSYFTEDLSTEHLSKEQIEELNEIIKQITSDAKSVVEDYVKNPSESSGSMVIVHENSPFLKDKD